MPDDPGLQRVFESGNINQVRQFVADAALHLGGSADDVFACELAAEEAAMNAHRHAYKGQGGKLDVRIWRDGNDIVISLRNWGLAFDPSEVPEPNIGLPRSERPIGGLGLYLIRRLMTQVQFSFDPQEGNELLLRKRVN